MIATVYSTVGASTYRDSFESHATAAACFESLKARAATAPEIRGAVLDLGGTAVTVWNRIDTDEA
jgi:hypothetical protein